MDLTLEQLVKINEYREIRATLEKFYTDRSLEEGDAYDQSSVIGSTKGLSRNNISNS